MKVRDRLPVEIAGLGFYVPDRVLTNQDLERMVDTSDEWITPRTGIKERRLAAPEQATSDLAICAARNALQQGDIAPESLGAIIVATCTPDHMFPATACLVQAAIGAAEAACYDLEAACSGFVVALAQGSALVAAGFVENVLVIGAETLSRVTDYTDRRTCILFGDGAGAAVLTRSSNGGEVIYCELGADGSHAELMVIPSSGSRLPASHETVDNRDGFMKIAGRDVFKLAVSKLVELLERVPQETGIPLDDIKLIIPHQSNLRIISSVCERAGISIEKAYMNIDRIGNTSAASIPIALAEAVQVGRLQRGDLVLLLAFGGGVTWGAILLKY